MNSIPCYDPTKTYEDNYKYGPFGLFSEGLSFPTPKQSSSLFDFPIDFPFGIPAGPLLNTRFITGAWNCGFSIAVYKTVRGNSYPTHPFPNVIKVNNSTNAVHPGDTLQGNLDISNVDIETDGITNSFGVPSQPPEVWQKDVAQAVKAQPKGKLLVLSFMGTKKEDYTREQYITDFTNTCTLAVQTQAPVLEVNFSCPNFGKEGLICNDVEMSTNILESLHSAKRNTPLLVKIGYFPKEAHATLNRLLDAIYHYADGVCAINTIAANVVDSENKQLLPGSPVRLSSGVCGSMIRWGGLEMAETIVSYKQQKNWRDFVIVGVGGVVKPNDYFTYKNIGVDVVMSATGSMWRPTLAKEIAEHLVS